MEARKSQGSLDQKEKAGPASITIPASPSMQKLGYGTGVNVYLMKRSPRGLSRSPWAVKKISSKCSKNQQNIYQSRLNEEAKILKSLKHPNIVGNAEGTVKVQRRNSSLLRSVLCVELGSGFHHDGTPLFQAGGDNRGSVKILAISGYRAFTEANDGSMCLVMEFGGEKSLNDLIEERNEACLGPFPAATISKVALSMARGLKYLHNDKKLLHGDIKSPNVVVKGDFEAIKICDVGVSLPLDENMTVSDPTVHYIGTEPWKPKEALSDDGVITDKADIFSFGLTLWEMMTLSVPHLNLDSNTDEDTSFDEDDFDEEAYYAALGTRPALNMDELDSSYQQVIELFSICTSEDPKKRPSAAHVVAVLEASLPPELVA